MKILDKRTKTLMGLSMAGLVMIAVGVIIGDPGILGNMIIIAVFISVTPYFLFRYSDYMWMRALEDQFPNFIRDLADATRSMPLTEAIRAISKSNYGKLTPEVVKMSNRLSWGTPFMRTLEIFEKSVSKSRIIREALGILKQSYESGGNVVMTLESISRDMMMLKETEEERLSLLKQHIFIMYAVFFMFVGISILIIFVMVPMIETQTELTGAAGSSKFGMTTMFSNPCPPESSMMMPCGFYLAVGTLFGVSPESIGSYYIALFFCAVVIQGLMIGLITGQLGENSMTAGIKHSMIMMFAAIGIFLFIAKVGLFPV
ncbi:MAG: type II secretion system F family protein [Deltaproteobacteria bacterium]|nr:type II secretion system F family protein [Deltaproteobacteria bacterium]